MAETLKPPPLSLSFLATVASVVLCVSWSALKVQRADRISLGQIFFSVDDSLSFSSYANVSSCFRVCFPRAIDACAQHVSRANEELAIDSLLVTDGLFRSRCAVCMAWYLYTSLSIVETSSCRRHHLRSLLYLCVYSWQFPWRGHWWCSAWA